MTPLPADFIRRQRQLLLRLRTELAAHHCRTVPECERDQLVEAGDAAQADESDHLRASLAELGARGMAEIDAALAKFDNGQYGLCELTGLPISKERLEAVPHARLSVEAQRQAEISRRGRDRLRRSYGVERDAT